MFSSSLALAVLRPRILQNPLHPLSVTSQTLSTSRSTFNEAKGQTSSDLQEAKFDDLYAALDVTPDATQTEIREGFFRMAKKFHPDINRDDPEAGDKFRRIQEAYKVMECVRQAVEKSYICMCLTKFDLSNLLS